jgi:hypothetical protein
VTLLIRRGRLDVGSALHPHVATPTSLAPSNYVSFQDLAPPALVAWLGDRATWQGHPAMGLLQVQRSDVLVNIFVQGFPDPEGHAHAAAVVVLRRLHS